MRRLIAALTLGLAACAGDDDGSARPEDVTQAADDAPACVDLFAPGRPTEDVVTQDDTYACRDTQGELFRAWATWWECSDGTVVHVVDGYGWGRDGDVWQAGDPPGLDDCG